MSIAIIVRVEGDGELPESAITYARGGLVRAMRGKLAPRIWRATPVDSGNTLRNWRIMRVPGGAALVNPVPYARWIRRGGLSRASMAILLKSLRGDIRRIIEARLRAWLESNEGQHWIWNNGLGPIPLRIPLTRIYLDVNV